MSGSKWSVFHACSESASNINVIVCVDQKNYKVDCMTVSVIMRNKIPVGLTLFIDLLNINL